MVVKLFVVISSYALAWLVAMLDYKKGWSDRRTKKHRLGIRALQFLLVASIVGSVVIVVRDERSADQLQTTVENVALAVGVSEPDKLVDAVKQLKSVADETEERQREMQTTLNAVAKTVGVAQRDEIATAVESLKTRATNAERQAAEANQKLEETSTRLSNVDARARPPELIMANLNVTKTANGREAILLFTPSKNASLGQLNFLAALPVNSQTKITDFWPSDGPPYTSGPDSKAISADGHNARLTYGLMSGGAFTVKLTLSGPSKVQISGEYLATPIVLTID